MSTDERKAKIRYLIHDIQRTCDLPLEKAVQMLKKEIKECSR